MHVIQCLIIALGFIWSTPAWGATWWVQSEYQAERLGQYLDALWPGHSLEIRIGKQDGQGIWFELGQLHLKTENIERNESMLWDYPIMVTTVRSWMATVSIDDGGWSPDWVAPTPEPVERVEPVASTKPAPPEPIPFPTPVVLQLGAGINWNTSILTNSPTFQGSLEFPFSFGAFSLGPHLGVNLGQRSTATYPDVINYQIVYHRWSLLLYAAWRSNRSAGVAEPFFRAGLRTYSAGLQRMLSDTSSPFVPSWSIAAGMKFWFTRTRFGEFGFGISADMDGRIGGLIVAGELLSPFTLNGFVVAQWGKKQTEL